MQAAEFPNGEDDMPTIRTVGTEARARLTRKPGAKDELAPYRDALAKLAEGTLIELTPDEGERMRTIKLRITRASKQLAKDAQYGETTDGTLLVWTHEPARRRRRRRVTGEEASAAGAALG